MPELNFKGKEFVYNHHLSVPFHPLEIHSDKGIGEANINDNLIIHGDNLKALKSLIPIYANKVQCVYIDPPYNTGNEDWCYNDNVNSPMIREWFSDNPVDADDGLRHDKWCAMMWPRLRLLRELLTENGVIFVSIDDNEQHHLRMMMDEIYGAENFLGLFLWRKKGTSTNVRGASVSAIADYQVCYRNSHHAVIKQRVTPKSTRRYRNKDHEGSYRTTIIEKRNDGSYERSTMQFQILGQYPREGKRWQFGEQTARNHEQKNRFVVDNSGVVKLKIYDFEDKDTRSANPTYLPDSCGSSNSADTLLTSILGTNDFENPKPPELVKHLIELASDKNAIILDSFAGSGTTAHAVLALNQQDGGKRKFILIECEKYADTITAERMRRVIRGVSSASDISLQKGLSGSFTYCTLGAQFETDAVLKGKSLPTYNQLGTLLFHVATSHPLDPDGIDQEASYLGELEGKHFWLIYRADLNWLKSPEAAFTLSFAREISRKKPANHSHLVFAAARFASQKVLVDQELHVEFAPLPFALYRIEKV